MHKIGLNILMPWKHPVDKNQQNQFQIFYTNNWVNF